MAREGGGVGSTAAERRRVALRVLNSGGEASSSAALRPPADEAVRTPNKGLLRGLGCTSAAASRVHAPAASADWRGLGCTSVAASQALAPASAAGALRSSVDWRGLGCMAAAASRAHEPAAAVDAARSSAEWRGRRRRKGKERRRARGGGGVVSAEGMGGDMWCAPFIPFAAEASSVDCVVAPHQPTVGTRRRARAERPHRERPGAPPARRVTMREHMSSSPVNSPLHHAMPFIDADRIPSGRNRHMSGLRHSRARLEEETMMFQARLLLGRMDMYDQYQDWRLDVDNMTYEELLDLEDRIGYVSTGLREDEIIRSLRMVKYSAFNPKHFPREMDRKCSICQEDFEADEETGRLSCGHSYHVHCIKQWLSRKNVCPVCKNIVSKT